MVIYLRNKKHDCLEMMDDMLSHGINCNKKKKKNIFFINFFVR